MSDAMFEHNGTKYHSNPTLVEFLDDAGFRASAAKRNATALEKSGIINVVPLLTMTKNQISDIHGITDKSAKRIFEHAILVKNKGSIVLDFDELKQREGTHNYLTTGSTVLDEMMNYADGSIGLRSRTLIEFFGEASMGKTQICLTAAAMCMRSVEDGGWGRGVAYIDSEGSFEGLRFEYLTRYWGVEREFLEDNLYYARVMNFDEVENAISEISKIASEKDIGLIVVDSIMDPLKAQYLVGGEHLTNLQPRQQHLKRVLDMLKNLANQHNAIVLYTNHVMASIDRYGSKIQPQGGAVLAHASDIRIYLSKAPKADVKSYIAKRHRKNLQDFSMKLCRARIVDCGFLPEGTGFFLVGPMGVADPRNIKSIMEQAKHIRKVGYLGTDAMGNKLDPIGEAVASRQEQIERTRRLLYAKDEDKDDAEEDDEDPEEDEEEGEE